MIQVGMDDGSPIFMSRTELDSIQSTVEIDEERAAAIKKNHHQWLASVTAFVLGLIFAAIALIPAAQFAIASLGGH